MRRSSSSTSRSCSRRYAGRCLSIAACVRSRSACAGMASSSTLTGPNPFDRLSLALVGRVGSRIAAIWVLGDREPLEVDLRIRRKIAKGLADLIRRIHAAGVEVAEMIENVGAPLATMASAAACRKERLAYPRVTMSGTSKA